MTNRAVWLICRLLINIGKRGAVPPPDIIEILHYAICPRCRNDIEAQGWRVEFKDDKKGIYEVTFKARETEESEDMPHEDEDEELEVKRPERLAVGEETPKRPEARFYVV